MIVLNLKFKDAKMPRVKAKRMLGFMNRNFSLKNKDLILPVYISLVRLHTEYGVEIYSPHRTKGIAKLESVHLKATKIITTLRNKI